MVVPTTVPASLASMDSAVVMVHSQLPHLPYPFMPGNPAAASIYAAAAHAAANPLVATSPAMQNVISLPVVDVPTSEPATVTVTAPQTTTVSAPQRHKENQSQSQSAREHLLAPNDRRERVSEDEREDDAIAEIVHRLDPLSAHCRCPCEQIPLPNLFARRAAACERLWLPTASAAAHQLLGGCLSFSDAARP